MRAISNSWRGWRCRGYRVGYFFLSGKVVRVKIESKWIKHMLCSSQS